MEFLLDGFRAVTWQQGVMYLVGFALIYLAIQKDYEPALLLPMGFGAILGNLPSSGVLNQMEMCIRDSYEKTADELSRAQLALDTVNQRDSFEFCE